VKMLKDAADTLQIPEEELVTLLEGLEMTGITQPAYTENGEGYFHDEEWQTAMDCIIAGNLLNWPDEYAPPGRAPKLLPNEPGKAPGAEPGAAAAGGDT